MWENVACLKFILFEAFEIFDSTTAYGSLLRGIAEGYGVTAATVFLLSNMLIGLVIIIDTVSSI